MGKGREKNCIVLELSLRITIILNVCMIKEIFIDLFGHDQISCCKNFQDFLTPSTRGAISLTSLECHSHVSGILKLEFSGKLCCRFSNKKKTLYNFGTERV